MSKRNKKSPVAIRAVAHIDNRHAGMEGNVAWSEVSLRGSETSQTE